MFNDPDRVNELKRKYQWCYQNTNPLKRKRKDSDDDNKNKHNGYDDDTDNGFPFGFFNNGGRKSGSDDNRIYFSGTVNKHTVDKLIQDIDDKNENFIRLKKNKMFKKVEPNPLLLFIKSYGGSVFEGFRAVDAIKGSKIPIYTVVDGYAASAATIMSVVGKKRYMRPSSILLIHQLSGGMVGKYQEMTDDHHNNVLFMNKIYDLYHKHSTMSKKFIKDQLSHDSWMDFNACKKHGLVDGEYK